ncbi:hypothetical protein [Streptomyces sp. NBC_00443]|uniref:hypothetical protein n=1 Tax=Streptomyces sp. NBC_00443 TaxID=2975743 RepID=UPI002E1C6947
MQRGSPSSFVVTTAPAGLTAAANVLNRRRVHGLLRKVTAAPARSADRPWIRATEPRP